MDDFRDLIDNNPNKAIRAISREPFTEVLFWWNKTGKPKDKYDVYTKGLEMAIANDRYDISMLKHVDNFPEFYQAVYNGLIKLFLEANITLVDDKCQKFYMARRIGIKHKLPHKLILSLLDQNSNNTVEYKGNTAKVHMCHKYREIRDNILSLRKRL